MGADGSSLDAGVETVGVLHVFANKAACTKLCAVELRGHLTRCEEMEVKAEWG